MTQIASIDHHKRRITAALVGFLAPADIVSIGVETRAAVRSLGLAGSAPHDLLYDLTATMVASPEAIAAIGTILRNPVYKHLWARNIAFVAPAALLRLQMERVVAGRLGLHVFADMESAETWLDAADDAVTGALDPVFSAAD